MASRVLARSERARPRLSRRGGPRPGPAPVARCRSPARGRSHALGRRRRASGVARTRSRPVMGGEGSIRGASGGGGGLGTRGVEGGGVARSAVCAAGPGAVSPSSLRLRSGVPTPTSRPGSTRIRSTRPGLQISISISAFSVSTSPTIAPRFTTSPGFTYQLEHRARLHVGPERRHRIIKHGRSPAGERRPRSARAGAAPPAPCVVHTGSGPRPSRRAGPVRRARRRRIPAAGPRSRPRGCHSASPRRRRPRDGSAPGSSTIVASSSGRRQRRSTTSTSSPSSAASARPRRASSAASRRR